MKLVRLSIAIEPAVRELAAEYEAEGIERFEAILQDYAAAVRAPEIHTGVPYTFFLAQREDGRLVGTIRVRQKPCAPTRPRSPRPLPLGQARDGAS